MKEAEKEIEYEDAHDLVFHRLLDQEKSGGRHGRERVHHSERDADSDLMSCGSSSGGSSYEIDLRDPLFSWRAFERERRAKKMQRLRERRQENSIELLGRGGEPKSGNGSHGSD